MAEMSSPTEPFPVRIAAVRSYIDTVRLQQYRALPAEIYQRLRKELPNRLIPSGKTHSTGHWSHFLTLQQPTKLSLEMLQEHLGQTRGALSRPSFKLTRVDVSLDVLVCSPADAGRATRYLQRHFMADGRHRQQWDFDRSLVEGSKINSTYSNEPDEDEGGASKDFRKGDLGFDMKRGVGASVYGDRPSKINGQPCAHTDWRVRGHVALRRLGLQSIPRLLELDHQLFWMGALQLSQPPTEQRLAAFIERHWDAQAKRSKARAERIASKAGRASSQRLAHALLRAFTDKDGSPNAHDLLLHLRASKGFGKHPDRLFTPISAEWLLPDSPRNALWEDLDQA